MVVAIVALVFALTGGAYAVVKIGAKQLKPGAVTTKKIKPKAVTTDRIADGAVTTPKLAAGERSEGFITHQAGAIPLPAATDTTVATLNLPAGGKYVVTAHASIGPNAATGEIVSCALRDDGTVLTQGFESTAAAAAFSAQVVATGVSDGGVVTLTCNPDAVSQVKERVIDATRVAVVSQQ